MKARLVASVVFLSVFYIALRLAAPGIVAGDSPELATAALTLGIPHPPGYPLWTLLGNALGRLQWGSPAFRVTILSVFCLSAVAALLGALLSRRGFDGNKGVALGFGLAYFSVLGPLVLSRASGPEVYVLHDLIAVALLFLVLNANNRSFEASCFLVGLGLAHHHLLFLLLPAWAWAFRHSWLSPSRAIRGLTFLLLGTSLYLCLPLRAKTQPFINWSHPSDAGQFWAHLTRRQYGTGLSSGAWVDGLWNMAEYARTIFMEGWGLLAVLALLGLWFRRRHVREDMPLLLGISALGVGLPILLRVRPNPENNEVISVFLPPLLFWLTPFALDGFKGLWRSKRWFPLFLAGAVLLAVRTTVPFNVSNENRNLAAEDMGRNFLQVLPRSAVLFCEGDTATFPLAYLQGVSRLRPDVKLFDRAGGLFEDIYKITDIRVKEPLNPFNMSKLEWEWEKAHPERPAYYSEKETALGRELEPAGMLFRATERNTVGPDLSGLWPRQREPRVGSRNDYLSRETGARFYVFRAVAGLRASAAPARVREDFAKAAQLAWDNSRILNNVGYEMLMTGWLKDCAEYFQQSVKRDEAFHLGWYNLGVLSRKSGRVADAEKYYKLALRARPDYNPARDALAGIYYQTNRQAQAVEEWTRILRINSDYIPVYHNLGFALLGVNNEQGKDLLRRYLIMKPDAPDRDAIMRALQNPL